jgi:hypothetical protein
MIETQLAHGSRLPAILATITVSGKEGLAVEANG